MANKENMIETFCDPIGSSDTPRKGEIVSLENVRDAIQKELESLIEVIGYGSPLEGLGSPYRLRAALCFSGDFIAWTSKRSNSEKIADNTEVLASIDITLYGNDEIYIDCLSDLTDDDIVLDDDGYVDAECDVDSDALAEAEEEAWELHCEIKISGWMDEIMQELSNRFPTPAEIVEFVSLRKIGCKED